MGEVGEKGQRVSDAIDKEIILFKSDYFKGDQGFAGMKGRAGYPGLPGEEGIRGPDGIDGCNGTDGEQVCSLEITLKKLVI